MYTYIYINNIIIIGTQVDTSSVHSGGVFGRMDPIRTPWVTSISEGVSFFILIEINIYYTRTCIFCDSLNVCLSVCLCVFDNVDCLSRSHVLCSSSIFLVKIKITCFVFTFCMRILIFYNNFL